MNYLSTYVIRMIIWIVDVSIIKVLSVYLVSLSFFPLLFSYKDFINLSFKFFVPSFPMCSNTLYLPGTVLLVPTLDTFCPSRVTPPLSLTTLFFQGVQPVVPHDTRVFGTNGHPYRTFTHTPSLGVPVSSPQTMVHQRVGDME